MIGESGGEVKRVGLREEDMIEESGGVVKRGGLREEVVMGR